MKNIAFITPDLKSGGSERIASRLTFLLGEKYKIYYIVFDDSDKSYDINAELINLNAKPSRLNLVKKSFNMIKRVRGLRKIIKEKNIQVAVSFTPTANRVLLLSRARCKRITSCRGFEHLQNHTMQYHAFIKGGCELLFNSREMEEFYLDKYPGDKDKLLTIENILDCDTIYERSKEPLEEKHAEFYRTHRTISTVGIFSAHKGFWDLFKSFEILKESVPDAGLILIGHRGLLENNLKEMAKRNKYSDDILLVGYQSNPFKFVAKSDVYALPSISEGMPNALLEAMACETPVVATACATGPRELLYDKFRKTVLTDYQIADNGILTPTFDGVVDYDYNNKSKAHYIFADALKRMLCDDELRRDLAVKGYMRARRNDISVIKDEYFNLIEK